MKKAVIIVSILLCSISAFALFSSRRSESISDVEIDILKTSVIIDSLSMNSDDSSPEGYIIHDNSFIINESLVDTNLKKTDTKSEKITSHKTGKKYLDELKKNDYRWHIVRHTVKKNDNLISIADKYNSDISHIARYNGIKNTHLIKKGSYIFVPTQNGIEYVIKSGDNVSSIAKKFRINLKEILLLNKIDSEKIITGQIIFLPSAKEEFTPELNAKSPVTNQNSENKRVISKKNTNETIKDKERLEAKNLKQYSFLIPASGKITSSFGIRRNPFNGKKEFHNGVDIGCPIGTPIKSSADGKVIFSGSKDGYGNMIVIEHIDKMITVYAHLDSMQKATGDEVKRNEVIALSGATGTVTGPHLHFEIRKNYVTALNPMRIIRR